MPVFTFQTCNKLPSRLLTNSLVGGKYGEVSSCKTPFCAHLSG